MTPELESWLANLKTGDRVFICSVTGEQHATVTRTSPKRIFVEHRIYRRDTGHRTKSIQGWLSMP